MRLDIDSLAFPHSSVQNATFFKLLDNFMNLELIWNLLQRSQISIEPSEKFEKNNSAIYFLFIEDLLSRLFIMTGQKSVLLI